MLSCPGVLQHSLPCTAHEDHATEQKGAHEADCKKSEEDAARLVPTSVSCKFL